MQKIFTSILRTTILSFLAILALPAKSSAECNADFGYHQDQGTLLVHFYDSSTSTFEIVSRLWTFGDGGVSDSHNPNHTYAEPGSYEVCLTIHDNHDCTDTYCQVIIVEPIGQGDCNALFEYEQIQNTLTIHFINQSTSEHDITSYSWNFGDGHNGDGQNPNHTYAEAGSYEVCLTIHDNTGCEDTYCHLVVVAPVNQGGCNALFEYEQIQNTLTIHFINQSTSDHDIISYSWNFGDGHNGDGQNPNHTYAEAGTYEVCLTIHDNTGCEDTYCLAVVVEPINTEDCNALFEYEQIQGTLTIHFIDHSTSSHDITSWFWDFGDGFESDNHAPNHTYAEPGSYEVCLTIHDNSGCSDTYCHVVIVEPIGQGGCNALFEYEQLQNSLTIHFINHSTSEHDITSYSWNFGDGHNGDGQNPNHTYAEAGTYEVCLIIHDNVGCTDTFCLAVIVEPVGQGGCEAFFGYYQSDNTLTINFVDSSYSQYNITSYSWNFGDGHTGDGMNPHHTYEHAGTYEVCLTIHGDCTDTYCQVVTVEPVEQGDCNALFEYNQIENTLTIHFTNLSTSEHDIISRLWDFGDGHTGDGLNPNHTYDQPGTYEVCLIIHDSTGCVDTFCLPVIVEPVSQGVCEAFFGYNQTDGTLTVNFFDSSFSQFNITSYSWNFGDGHTGDGMNPHHTYEHAGTYEVCLTIHGDCTDTYCQVVTVEPVEQGDCNALFEYNQIENTLTIHFTNLSTSEHDIISRLWDFGDGHIGDGLNPNHTYDQPGTYEVCLIIHDNTGCVDTFCLPVIVEPVSQGECEAYFDYYQLQNSLTIQFVDSSFSQYNITSYSWNFGDGHEGDGQNPHHTYEHSGTYEVCLTIHGDCTDTYCHVVTVEPLSQGDCNALFEYQQLENSFTIHFTDLSTSNHDIVSWSWNFGDGHNGDGQNPNHTYEHAGEYEVCLTIHDNNDCNDTYCHVVHVVEDMNACHASFEADVDSTGLTVYFTNTSTNTTEHTTYLWTFGDGSSSTDEDPIHTYSHEDNYTVCLIITDTTTDCSSDYCHVVHVHPQGGAHQAGQFTANNNGGQEKSEWDQVRSHFVTIFPNPFSTTTYVQYELEKEMDVRIELNDLFGNRIRQISDVAEQKGTHTHEIEAGYLNPGIYLIKVMIGNEVMIRKIIITQ